MFPIAADRFDWPAQCEPAFKTAIRSGYGSEARVRSRRLPLLTRMSDEIELPALPVGSLLAEIDAQQDDLLRQLDELNERLECLLRECSPPAAMPSVLHAA